MPGTLGKGGEKFGEELGLPGNFYAPNITPESEASFPMNLIMRTIPTDPSHQTRPPVTDKVAYGKYMIIAAACADCHTQMEKGEPLPGMDYAGGFPFPLPSGMLHSANITPDSETGIGNWTEDMFVQRFRAYTDSMFIEPRLGPSDFNTIMPWRLLANMHEEDLRAIYAYLRTVAPVKNQVVRFTPKQ